MLVFRQEVVHSLSWKKYKTHWAIYFPNSTWNRFDEMLINYNV